MTAPFPTRPAVGAVLWGGAEACCLRLGGFSEVLAFFFDLETLFDVGYKGMLKLSSARSPLVRKHQNHQKQPCLPKRKKNSIHKPPRYSTKWSFRGHPKALGQEEPFFFVGTVLEFFVTFSRVF